MYIEYKKGEKFAVKNADMSDSLEHFEDAGYILNDDDLIIDIDCLDKKIIEIMIRQFGLNTKTVWTDRGVHLYFKKPVGFKGANKVCALGFKIECKHIKNTKSITIKRNGIERKVENDNIKMDLPDIFSVNKHFVDMLGLEEGDGRNNKLFEHRAKLVGMSGEKRILNFINSYIFASPLDPDEFEVISREKQFSTGKNTEYENATLLMREMKVCVYKEQIYYYDGIRYTSNKLDLKKRIYDYIGSQKTNYIDEIYNQMMYRGKRIDESINMPVKLSNGILNNGEFDEIDYVDFTPYYIDIPYNKDAKPVKIVDEYINNLTDNEKEYRNLLLEIIAHTLITNPETKRCLAKFFIFVGDGGNGKGTLLEVIRKILNTTNCSALSIKQMSDERYLFNMFGKLANLGDDIQDQPINDKDMKILKNISTCDFTDIRKMFANSVSTSITASLIFTSNHVLKSWEKGESYKRRVLWAPMFNKPKSKDARFITKLTSDDALEYWLKLIVEAYFRLIKSGFTESEKVNEFNRAYHEENNGAALFVQEADSDFFLNKTGPDVYQEFEIWCTENEVNPSKKMLKEAVRNIHNMEVKPSKIGGKTRKVYKYIE